MHPRENTKQQQAIAQTHTHRHRQASVSSCIYILIGFHDSCNTRAPAAAEEEEDVSSRCLNQLASLSHSAPKREGEIEAAGSERSGLFVLRRKKSMIVV